MHIKKYNDSKKCFLRFWCKRQRFCQNAVKVLRIFIDWILNRDSLFTLNMTEDLGLCPECQLGYLRPMGKVNIGIEKAGEFRDNDDMRDLICDNCGHKEKSAALWKRIEKWRSDGPVSNYKTTIPVLDRTESIIINIIIHLYY